MKNVTKESVLGKVEAIIDDMNFKQWAMQKAEKALDSGVINLEDFEDNYALPKNIISMIGREMQRQYSPLSFSDNSRKTKKLLNDIYRVI
jgi:hypothetical protein